MKVISPKSKEFEKLLYNNNIRKKRISRKVADIIENVRARRDPAVLEYTRKFDKVKLTAKDLAVTEREINASFKDLDSALILAIKKAIDNVTRFYKRQYPKGLNMRNQDGRKVREKLVPLDRVGIYVPGGQAPLVSSVYMCAVPAIVAGVKEIVLVSPPDKSGHIDANILAVASMLKIKEIYKAGGAQGIAALGLGTDTISKVDKIVGPGNEYVTEAKKQLFGLTGIDLLAGPSEVVIVAGSKANPEYIIKDLQAQTEHHKGLGIVVTSSKTLLRQLRKNTIPGVHLILVKNFDDAVNVVNLIAPEHLEVMLRKSGRFVKRIRHAGAIFVGDYTPTAIGDYLAGPSHVLPTQRTARFFSGLSVCDFLKRIHIVTYSKKALVQDAEALEKIAGLENMKKHYESVQIRIQ